MKIIYLHQYFYTPNMVGVAGVRSYELGRRLVAKGHQVQMVTSDTHAKVGASRDWYVSEESGIKVNWLPVPYSNKMSFKKRIGAFIRFAWKSSWKAASLEGDIIYATSGPLTIAIPAIFASFIKRKPLVFEVRDLWPEGAIQLGVLKNPFAKFFARTLERFVYGYSNHIVALSPGMKDGIVASGVSPSKVNVIPNASDLDFFDPSAIGSASRNKFQLDNKFALAYFGTMGLANGLEYVLDAAAILKQRGNKNILFILHGDGMQRAALEERVESEGLNNVTFSGPVESKAEVADLAAAVDVCMTIYSNYPVLATCSPNKLFDTFAAGRPALTNMPGPLQDLLEENNCGAFVDPNSPEDLADTAVEMSKLSVEAIDQMRRNSRSLGERVFSRAMLADKLALILESVVKTKQASEPPIIDLW